MTYMSYKNPNQTPSPDKTTESKLQESAMEMYKYLQYLSDYLRELASGVGNSEWEDNAKNTADEIDEFLEGITDEEAK